MPLIAVQDALAEAGDIDHTIKEWRPLLDEAFVSLSELSRNVQNYLERLDIDPARLEEIESRLYEIKMASGYKNVYEALAFKTGHRVEIIGEYACAHDQIGNQDQEKYV